MKKNFAIIGVGLIGGSFALKCKSLGLAEKVIGVDNDPRHAEKALERGLVDEMLDLSTAIAHADVVVLAIPVNILAVL
ncbi:MAG: hypothetical protein RL642_174, partial [Bacteroidota bacterium]